MPLNHEKAQVDDFGSVNSETSMVGNRWTVASWSRGTREQLGMVECVHGVCEEHGTDKIVRSPLRLNQGHRRPPPREASMSDAMRRSQRMER